MRQRLTLLFDVFALGQTVGTFLSTAMEASPLRPTEFAVYSLVLETKQCTPTGMARELDVPLQTVSDWIATMRKREHITSTPHHEDGRSYVIELTPKGKQVHREAGKAFDRANRVFLEQLPLEESAHRAELQDVITAARQAHMRLINRKPVIKKSPTIRGASGAGL